MDRKVSNTYMIQHVNSASPARLVAMLYDRAITLLNEAVGAIEDGQIERRWAANSKASEVICHLWETLDLEQGGEVAANLDRLYGFMIRRLTTVDVNNDPQPARDVIGLLEPLRRSWHQLADQVEAEDAPSCEQATGSPSPVSLSA